MRQSSSVPVANTLYLICSFLLFNCLHQVENRTLAKPRALSYIANQTVCMVDKVIYRDGDPIPTDDPCETCKCRPPGFSCVLRECEVKPGCKAIRREGECCPEYQCGCEHNGKFFSDGERVPYAESPCYTCHCQGSSITCGLADCKFRFDCEPEYYPGDCCPRYDHCPPEPTSTTTTTTTSTTTTTTTTTTEAPIITTLLTSTVSEMVSSSVTPAAATMSTLNVTDVTESASTVDEMTTRMSVDRGESTSAVSADTPMVEQSNVSTGNTSQVNDTTEQSNVIPVSSADVASTNSPATVFEVNDSSSSMGVSDTTVASVTSSTRDEVVNEITSHTHDNDASTSSNYPVDVMVTTLPSIASEVETNPPVTTVGSNKLTESPINELNDTLDVLSSSPSSSSASSVLSPGISDDATTTPPSQVINVSELVKGQSQDDSMTAITIITTSSSPPPSSAGEAWTAAPSSTSPATTVLNDNSQVFTEVSSNVSSVTQVDSDLTTQISLSPAQVSGDSSNVTRDIISDIISPAANNSQVSTVTSVNVANDEITTDYPTTRAWIPDTALAKEHREGSLNETTVATIDSTEVTNPVVSSTEAVSQQPPVTSTADNLISSPQPTTINSVSIDKDEVVDVTTQSVITSPEITEVVTSSTISN